MTGSRVGVCAYCGAEFEASNARGPVPKYCRRSHRQRAYEQQVARQTEDYLAGENSRPSKPTADEKAKALRHLRDAIADVAENDLTKPTVLRARLIGLIESFTAALARTGLDDPFDNEAVQRLQLVGLAAESVVNAHATVTTHPRSAARLKREWAGLQAAAETFIDPAAGAFHGDRHVGVIPVTIPGPDKLLPIGELRCDIRKGKRQITWLPDDDHTIWPTPLHKIANQATPADPYRLNDPSEWERLGGDIIKTVCGWLSSQRPLPPLLNESAATRLGQQLHRQFNRNQPEWSLHATAITTWLTNAGYTRTGYQTGITDHTTQLNPHH